MYKYLRFSRPGEWYVTLASLMFFSSLVNGSESIWPTRVDPGPLPVVEAMKIPPNGVQMPGISEGLLECQCILF